MLTTPLLYLSAFFEATRDEYYKRLNAVTREAAWDEWLEYFLNGVARIAEDSLRRAERINTLLAEWRETVAGASSATASSLVELLAENPFWTVMKVADRLDVAYTTAQRAMEKLISAGILERVGEKKRGRVVCAWKIMEILNQPARLGP